MKIAYYIAAAAVLAFGSCKKDSGLDYNSNQKGELSIEFDNIVGGQNLVLNSGSYVNASGETYNVTTLKYYISNIALKRTDGTTYTVPQNDSYFLIDESNPSATQPKIQVPEGEYTALQFIVGVDSLRNTKDISERTGVLDPAGEGNGMYWSWNSGYIFLKLEGTSAASPEDGHLFMYHIGGFGGYTSPSLNNIKTINLDLKAGGTPKVLKDKKSNIHLMVDISKLLDGANKISIAANPSVMFGDLSAVIANNYATMFRHDHTEN